MTKKVVFAKFHSSLFMPQLGEMYDTLPNKKKSYELDMSTSEEGLVVRAKTKTSAWVTGLVPWANVKICQFSEDMPQEKAPTKSNKQS